MKKICFINPPSYHLLSDKDNPPLGLMTVAGYIRAVTDWEILMCDLAGKGKDLWEIPVADVYGLTATVTQHAVIGEIVSLARRANPNARIVLGGPHASTLKEKLLSEFPGIDQIIVGDGEYALLSILEGKDNSKIIHGVSEQNLDLFPFPVWDMMEGYYATVWHKDASIKGKTLITARGCCYACSFCSSPLLSDRRVRYHSVEYVQRQIEWLLSMGECEGIYFVDDILPLDRKRMRRLAEMLKGFGLPWRCYARVDTMKDPELLSLMADGGCVQIDYGLESGSDEVLKYVEKTSTVERALRAVQLTLDAGISPKCCFIAGLPHETEETMSETKRFIEKLMGMGDVLFAINLFVPIPGSAIGDDPEAFNYPIDRSVPYSEYMGRDYDPTYIIDPKFRADSVRWYKELLDLTNERSANYVARKKREATCGSP